MCTVRLNHGFTGIYNAIVLGLAALGLLPLILAIGIGAILQVIVEVGRLILR